MKGHFLSSREMGSDVKHRVCVSQTQPHSLGLAEWEEPRSRAQNDFKFLSNFKKKILP